MRENQRSEWPRRLVGLGLFAMVVGALDPLEGSLLILPGAGLSALGGRLGNNRYRRAMYWSFGLMVLGVAALWWLSALGGFGGDSGRSVWWGLAALPFPVGWVMALVSAVAGFRSGNARTQ